MPSSPISKEILLPENWVQLQKTMIPDQATSCYWSVWYNVEDTPVEGTHAGWEYSPAHEPEGTAWLMWCPIGDDPSINDHWGHVEDLEEDCRNILTVIESVYGVSFHESIWVKMTATEILKDNQMETK